MLGYVEGDYVYMALPESGRLTEHPCGARRPRRSRRAALCPRRHGGTRATSPRRRRDLAEAERTLADLRPGERPEELAVIQAQLDSAQASLMLSEPRVKRRRQLVKDNVVGVEDLDAAEASILEDRGRIAEMTRAPGRRQAAGTRRPDRGAGSGRRRVPRGDQRGAMVAG